MKRMTMTIMVCALAAATSVSTLAATIIEDQGDDWDALRFDEAGGHTTITGQSATEWGAGNPGVSFNGLATGGQPYQDHVFEDVTLAGDYTAGGLAPDGVFAITFDFHDQGNYAPDALAVYLQANGFTWYYNVTPTTDTFVGEQSYVAILGGGAGWYSTDGGTVFMDDIANVTRAGIMLVYDTTDGGSQQFYGISNYTLQDEGGFYVPEPSTYMLLSTAVMSLGFSFARRRRDKVS
jgi:hypothetical protein